MYNNHLEMKDAVIVFDWLFKLMVERQKKMCLKRVISDVLSEFSCFIKTVNPIPSALCCGSLLLHPNSQTQQVLGTQCTHPTALLPQNTRLQMLSPKTVSRKAERVFCASSLLSAGKREGTGG